MRKYHLDTMMRFINPSVLTALFLSLCIAVFQNCSDKSGSIEQSSKLSDIAGENYCHVRTDDPACQTKKTILCKFNHRELSPGETLTAYKYSNGQCVQETRKCLPNGSLSGSYMFSHCHPAAEKSCLLNNKTLANNESLTAYLNSTPQNGLCKSETRTCVNGELSGSYRYTTCETNYKSSCIFKGHELKHGESITAFSKASSKGVCTSSRRKCLNGLLTGTGENLDCTLKSEKTCVFDGKTIFNGQTVIAYKSSQSSPGLNCESLKQTRTCKAGHLTGDAKFSFCTSDQPKACLINGLSINSGEEIKFYETGKVEKSIYCEAKTRKCRGGLITGSATLGTCRVEPK